MRCRRFSSSAPAPDVRAVFEGADFRRREGPRRCLTGQALGDDCVFFPRRNDLARIPITAIAFFRADQAGAKLRANRPHGQCRKKAARITNTARCDHRNLHGIHNHRHQRQRRDAADMTARFRP